MIILKKLALGFFILFISVALAALAAVGVLFLTSKNLLLSLLCFSPFIAIVSYAIGSALID